MRSSTIRRSTLSKEAMDLIENLSKEESYYVNEYKHENNSNIKLPEDKANKSNEIDLLWESFKPAQFSTNSPIVLILIGFILGVTSTLMMYFAVKYFTPSLKTPAPVEQVQTNDVEEEEQVEENQINAPTDSEIVAPVEQETNKSESTQETTSVTPEDVKTKKYIVKDGDTGEAIIKKTYGSYSPEKAEQIIKLNNLENLDRLHIDQVILLPM